MKHIFIIIIFAILLCSCGENDSPKVVYTDDSVENAEPMALEKDTSVIEIADLPIHIDSTNYLIHPIGEYRIYRHRKTMYSGSANSGSGSFKIADHHGYDIRGNLYNLKFQQLGTGILTSLTTKNIRIKSVSFLRDIFDNTNKQYLAYRVIDKDTNRDNKLDDKDVGTLYLSNIDGSEFKKITAEAHELIDWQVRKVANRLYFRSIEDTNRNGEFDKYDKLHYHFIDFNKTPFTTTEYKPI